MPLGWRTCLWVVAKISCTSWGSSVILCIDVILLLTSILLLLLLLRLQLSAKGLHKELIIWFTQTNQGSRINFGHILIYQIKILWPTNFHKIIGQPLLLPFSLNIGPLHFLLPCELHTFPWSFLLRLLLIWTCIIVVVQHGVLPCLLERLAGVTLSPLLECWGLTARGTIADVGRWLLDCSILMSRVGICLRSHVVLQA